MKQVNYRIFSLKSLFALSTLFVIGLVAEMVWAQTKTTSSLTEIRSCLHLLDSGEVSQTPEKARCRDLLTTQLASEIQDSKRTTDALHTHGTQPKPLLDSIRGLMNAGASREAMLSGEEVLQISGAWSESKYFKKGEDLALLPTTTNFQEMRSDLMRHLGAYLKQRPNSGEIAPEKVTLGVFAGRLKAKFLNPSGSAAPRDEGGSLESGGND